MFALDWCLRGAADHSACHAQASPTNRARNATKPSSGALSPRNTNASASGFGAADSRGRAADRFQSTIRRV